MPKPTPSPCRVTEQVVERRECERCKQALRIVRFPDQRLVAFDAKTKTRHVCWDLPEDANLLVMDD